MIWFVCILCWVVDGLQFPLQFKHCWWKIYAGPKSSEIRSMFRHCPVLTQDVCRFFNNLNNVYRLFTWPTLWSYLLSLNNPFFIDKLWTSPQDGFVQHHLNKRLFGKLLIGWKDAVGCPRAAKIRCLVEELKQFVGSDEASTTNADKIKVIIGKID